MGFFIVYGRASSDPEDKRISVDRQIKLGVQRGKQRWPGARALVYRDDDITAADETRLRPGFAEAMTAISLATDDDPIVGFVVDRQSRLTRMGEGHWEQIIVRLTRAGLSEVETIKGGPVSVAEGNRLVGRITAVIDQEYVEVLRANVRDAHKVLFEEGRPSGRPPYGFMIDPDAGASDRTSWVHHPDQAPVVRDIFAWTVEGVAMGVIADKLNEAGVPPRSATWTYRRRPRTTPARWTANTVRSLLRAPSMAGLRGHTDQEGVLHTVPASAWDPIVSVDQWHKVQRILGRPTTVTGADGKVYRVRTKPAPTPRRYLLSGGHRDGVAYGVLRCGRCGYPLAAQTQGRRDGSRIPAYQCHPSKTDPRACGGVSISPAEAVEATVVAALQARLAKSGKVRRQLDATTDREVAEVRGERDAARATMLDAGRMLGAATIDHAVFDQMHGAAQARYDAAQARLDAMVADEAHLPCADDVVHRWEELTLRQQRGVVERLVERIDVAPARGGVAGFDESRVSVPIWRV